MYVSRRAVFDLVVFQVVLQSWSCFFLSRLIVVIVWFIRWLNVVLWLIHMAWVYYAWYDLRRSRWISASVTAGCDFCLMWHGPCVSWTDDWWWCYSMMSHVWRSSDISKSFFFFMGLKHNLQNVESKKSSFNGPPLIKFYGFKTCRTFRILRIFTGLNNWHSRVKVCLARPYETDVLWVMCPLLLLCQGGGCKWSLWIVKRMWLFMMFFGSLRNLCRSCICTIFKVKYNKELRCCTDALADWSGSPDVRKRVFSFGHGSQQMSQRHFLKLFFFFSSVKMRMWSNSDPSKKPWIISQSQFDLFYSSCSLAFDQRLVSSFTRKWCVLTFHLLLLFFFFFLSSLSLPPHALSPLRLLPPPDKQQEKHVWVLGVICSVDLADPWTRSCRLLYAPPPFPWPFNRGSLRTMSAEVENSAPVPPADPSVASPTTASNSPPTSPATSKVPFRKEKKKGERQKMRWLQLIPRLTEDFLEMLVLSLLQSQRRQMSTWWAGFKGTAWGTRPSWLASMMSQRPEETRCARTPWWNLRCSVGPRSVLC